MPKKKDKKSIFNKVLSFVLPKKEEKEKEGGKEREETFDSPENHYDIPNFNPDNNKAYLLNERYYQDRNELTGRINDNMSIDLAILMGSNVDNTPQIKHTSRKEEHYSNDKANISNLTHNTKQIKNNSTQNYYSSPSSDYGFGIINQ